jgi:hypothetical protein
MSKIIFKNKKYIILICFKIKNTLKNNHNHASKHVYTYLLTKQWLHRSALCCQTSTREDILFITGMAAVAPVFPNPKNQMICF